MLNLPKRLASRLFYRPAEMEMGARSTVRLPRWIVNPDRIRIGEDSHVMRHCKLEAYQAHSGGTLDGHIVIGSDVYIGSYCMLSAMNEIRIGDGCVLSDNVYISDASHGLDPVGGLIMKQPLVSKGPVVIGNRCFIGLGASILPGITLGEHCIVGTRSVVTKSFPAYSLVVGNPARRIKTYDLERAFWVTL